MVHTLEDRARALCAFAECGCYREAARRTGISFENIRRWERAGLYATLSVKKEVAMDKLPDELPDNPEELKRIIHDQQLEIDLMKAVVDIVKKRPRRRPDNPDEQGEDNAGRRPETDVFTDLFGE